MQETLKVLITIKTHPIPSAKYDELVCTAGVTERGDFVRLYPINFRDLPYSQQYKKYQWIQVAAAKHTGRDARKESYRPRCETLKTLGEPLSASRNWAERAKYVLAHRSASLEDLQDQQAVDRTSLGIFRPKAVHDLVIAPDDPHWKPSFLQELKQARLWEDRSVSREPPRKVPFRFRYKFECDDTRCRGHEMMIEDWEVGALYWRLVDQYRLTPEDAAIKVKHKFLDEICNPRNETYFFVGTVLTHPTSWVVVGLFYPRAQSKQPRKPVNLRLFD